MIIGKLLEINVLGEIKFQSNEERDNFLEQYSDILSNRLQERITPLMSEEEHKHVINTIDEDHSVEDICLVVANYIPHIVEIIGEEIIDLKEETYLLLGPSLNPA